ncbi:MAG: citrate synthase, partial [Arcticibacterium sp.]
MSKTAKLIYKENEYEFPVITGTEDESAIDISTLRGQSGAVTIDLGFKNTGSTTSAITFLDGEKGILRYRGYDIEELADKADFLGVSYLLIYGELPNKEQYDKFVNDITRHTMVNEDMRKIFDGFPVNSHPMGVMSSLVSAMSGFYPESYGKNGDKDMDLQIIRLMAKLPTLATWCYKKSQGHPINYPKNNLDYCSNFLQMMFGLPVEGYEIDPVVAK